MTVKSDGFFAVVPEWVLYAEVSSHAVRLYATLRRYADKNGKAHPSRTTLANHCHTSVATIKRALAELGAIGAVVREERFDGQGRQTSNDYVVMTHPRVTGEPPGGVTGEPHPRVTGDPQNQSHKEPEPEEPESAARPRDPVFDALAVIQGSNLVAMTRRESRAVGVALAEIRAVSPDVDGGEIRRRAANFRRVTPPGTTLTANALASWWSRCGGEPGPDIDDRPLVERMRARSA